MPERKEVVDRVDYDDKDRLDEIVGCGVTHLERLSKNSWFLSIGHADGSSTALWFTSKKFPDLMETHAARPLPEERK